MTTAAEQWCRCKRDYPPAGSTPARSIPRPERESARGGFKPDGPARLFDFLADPHMDLTDGIFRSIYSNYIWGQRINSVSLECEAWFWRLHAAADDYGNLPADEARLSASTKGLRTKMRDSEVAALCACLEKACLIVRYSVNGENFYHIIGFTDRQRPPSRNGRRIQRFPMHPPECDQSKHGESEQSQCIQGATAQSKVQPRTVRTSDSDSESESEPDSESKPPVAAQPAPRGGRRVVEVQPGFAAFWAAWPPHKRKADEDRCAAKWRALGLETEADAIVAKVKAWAASEDWTKDDRQFIPAPIVWLNKKAYKAPAPGETPENTRATWLKSLTDQQRGEMVAEFRAIEKSLPRGTTFGEWAWGKYGPGGAA